MIYNIPSSKPPWRHPRLACLLINYTCHDQLNFWAWLSYPEEQKRTFWKLLGSSPETKTYQRNLGNLTPRWNTYSFVNITDPGELCLEVSSTLRALPLSLSFFLTFFLLLYYIFAFNKSCIWVQSFLSILGGLAQQILKSNDTHGLYIKWHSICIELTYILPYTLNHLYIILMLDIM